MPTRFSYELFVISLLFQHAAKKHFEHLTGMTLDEWDELYCQRIMAAG